jgi:hypothetical protein
LGSSLPLGELARRDSVLFREVKRLFSTAPEAEKQRRKSGVFLTKKIVTGRYTGRGPRWTCASGQLKSRAEAQRA